MATTKKRVRIRPTKKARELAKSKLNAAMRKVQAKGSPVAPAALVVPATVEQAGPVLRELIAAADSLEEDPGGQLIIPGAGPRLPVEQVRAGDENPYVMTLRLTRRHARIIRFIAAMNGHTWPASWVIEALEKAMKSELAELAK